MRVRRRRAREFLRVSRAVVLVLVAMLAGLAPAAEAQSVEDPVAAAPVISAPAGAQTVGARITITGGGWMPFSTLSAAVCGNQGLRGSADCTSLGRSFFSRSDGGVVFEDVLARPPSACPCIVRVREIAGPAEATAPIEIAGMEVPVAEDPADTVSAPEPPQLVVDEVRVVGGGWKAALGLPSTRTLEVVVTNPGPTTVTAPPFSAAWGDAGDPSHLIDTVPAADIEPGETVTLSADFDSGPFTFGSYEVSGQVGPPWAPAPFASSFTSRPWGLILVLLAAAVTAVAVLVGRRRKRSVEAEEEAPPPLPAGDTVDAPAAAREPVDVVDVRDSVLEVAGTVAAVPVVAAPIVPAPPARRETVDVRALEEDLADELARVLSALEDFGSHDHPELVAASVAAEVAAVVGARHELSPDVVEAMAADLSESLALEMGSVLTGPR